MPKKKYANFVVQLLWYMYVPYLFWRLVRVSATAVWSGDFIQLTVYHYRYEQFETVITNKIGATKFFEARISRQMIYIEQQK